MIDHGKISRRLLLTKGREFQPRPESIRRDYWRMAEKGSSTMRDVMKYTPLLLGRVLDDRAGLLPKVDNYCILQK
jgi:hypothetical protein